jgi:hypothetical protein
MDVGEKAFGANDQQRTEKRWQQEAGAFSEKLSSHQRSSRAKCDAKMLYRESLGIYH